jgi:hypothetical protein
MIIPLDEDEIYESFPMNNYISNFHRTTGADQEIIEDEFERYNQIFSLESFQNSDKDEELNDEEIYMNKDNSKSTTIPLSKITEHSKEDIKINPKEKNKICKIYYPKDIKKILKENNFPDDITKKIKEDYIKDEDKQSVICVRFKNSPDAKEKKKHEKKKKSNSVLVGFGQGTDDKITNKKDKVLIGRKKQSEIKKGKIGKHNKYSADNIKKKNKRILFSNVIDYNNMFINKYKTNCEQKGELLYLNYKKYVNNLTKNKEIALLKMKLKDLLSLEVTKKKKSNSDKFFNRNYINHILEVTEKNNETFQNFFNNITFEDWIDIFTKKKEDFNLKEFNGLQSALKNIAKECKDDGEYFTKFIFHLFNYKNWFYNKKGRERKKANIEL